jgi:hypothetical protein
MRKLRIHGWAIAVLVGLSLNVRAMGADPENSDRPAAAKNSTMTTWWSWFGPKDKGDSKSPAKREAKPTGERAASKPAGKKDEPAEQRAGELATLLRRLAVCDQLRLIANQKQDDSLRQQAEELEERCWERYNRRIAHLPASRASAGPDLDKAVLREVDIEVGEHPAAFAGAGAPSQ